ncbi:MAG TPA: OmpH family outer membrane protein [Candidatus Adamsella sp.]|nr:OmpH family outer membrane protein [Candidatus Adamsella sp.]
MKINKKVLCTMIMTGAVMMCTNMANAAGIGYIELSKVLKNYTYAQQISTEVKNKDIEIQKFMTEANQKINNAKSPVEKKNLEQKYSAEFKAKLTAFQDYQVDKQKEVENNIINAVKLVAKEQKLDAVFTSGVLLYGGVDISGNVVLKLNSLKK